MPCSCGRTFEVALAGGMRIHSGMPPQCLRIRQAFRRLEAALGREQLGDQRLDLRHQGRIVESQPIPLEQGEFGVVPAAALGVAKYLAQLIDVAAAGGQQAFHGKFRRRAHEQRSRACRLTRVIKDSICGSLAPAELNTGVSTSSTPRAAKNARTRANRAARCRKAA